MEKSTYRTASGAANLCEIDEAGTDEVKKSVARQKAFDRLADYEGTGLEPQEIQALQTARPLEEWGEDYGDVLWWKFPIEEAPYCGNPLDSDWPGYHTHWTKIVCPEPPKGEKPC